MEKKHYIVVDDTGFFNVTAETVEEIRAEFGADCTIYQEVEDNG